MAKKRKKSSDSEKLKLVTPAGALQWPKLYKPETQFNPEGTYSTDLVMKLSAPGVKEFVEKVKEFHGEVDAGPHLPFKTDKEAGSITLKAKSREKPVVVDAEKNIMKCDPNMGNGTIARLSVCFAPFEQSGGGVTCYLQAAQIIELKPYLRGVDAFDAVAGYVAGNGAEDREEAQAAAPENENEGVSNDDEEF